MKSTAIVAMGAGQPEFPVAKGLRGACWKAALLLLGLLGAGALPAQAQSNAIEAVNVIEQGGNIIVRVRTKEPLKSVPANFSVANPARIAFDFPNTSN